MSKPKRKYYKVVTVRSSTEFRSAWVNPNHPLCTTYKRRQRTSAKWGTKLFVFDTLESAMTFKNELLGWDGRVFECTVTNPTELTSRIPSINAYGVSIDDVVRWFASGAHVTFWDTRKTGTVLVDSLVLLKEVGR
jgi:hypothetical protein